MAIKKPIPITFNLDSHQSVQSVCAVIHIDDKNTETLDLSLMQGGEHIAVSPNSTVTARFVRVKNNTLISDDITCTVQENGNIYIPIDNAAAHMLVGEIKIEVNIVDENDILTMQFPLVIRVNNTILADAEICPISKGTIPELIEKAQETADNAIAELGNKQDTLTAGENITIEDNVISAACGTDDYDELKNKPQINGYTLSGNQSDESLDLQRVLTFEDFSGPYSHLEEIIVAGGLKISPVYGNDKAVTISIKGLPFEVNDYPYVPYDFELSFESPNFLDYKNFGFYCMPTDSQHFINIPNIFNSHKILAICHSPIHVVKSGFNYIECLRYVVTLDEAKNEFHIFYQYENNNFEWGEWQELTGGGAQIVSGAVNANGTITFTDSEGNSFTTSGESVIGADGFSPSATVQQTASGATITVTDKNGTTTANISNGAPGQDYVLTAQDKTDIANIVLGELPTTEGVLYGNQSN